MGKKVKRNKDVELEEGEEPESNGDVEYVRMKAPAGVGNVGLAVGDDVVQVEPDEDGEVEVTHDCVGPLRALGFSTVGRD